MKQLLKGRGRRLWACVLGVALSAAVLASPAALAATLPSLPADECVVDDAGVLSDETTAYMDELNGALEANCAGAQIGVLTVKSTGDITAENYAMEAFNTWGIGSSSENNGMLILLIMESPLFEDGDYYVTYGCGFDDTEMAQQISALAQTMEDDFAAGDYDSAVQTCAAAVADTIANIYGVRLKAPIEADFVTVAAPRDGEQSVAAMI